MTLLVFCLTSIIVSLVWSKVSNKNCVLLSYVPLLVYLVIKSEILSPELISILVPTLITLTFYLIKTNKITHGLKQVLIFSPWCIVLFCQMHSLLDLTFFIVGINLVAFSIGEEKAFNNKKLIQYESSHILSMCVLGFIVMIFSVLATGNIGLNQISGTGHFYEIFQYLLIIFLFISLGAFGSFSNTEKVLKQLNPTNKDIYLFLKIFIIPFIVASNLKTIIDSSFVTINGHMLLILFLCAIYVFIIDLKRTCFNLKSYSIAKFNLISIVVLYALVDEVSITFLAILLFFNYVVFLLVKNFQFTKSINYIVKVLFLVAPISPMFYVKIIYYSSATKLMNPLLVAVFTIFLFLPLMFTHKLEKLDQ
jgi:hypothetical protein